MAQESTGEVPPPEKIFSPQEISAGVLTLLDSEVALPDRTKELIRNVMENNPPLCDYGIKMHTLRRTESQTAGKSGRKENIRFLTEDELLELVGGLVVLGCRLEIENTERDLNTARFPEHALTITGFDSQVVPTAIKPKLGL